MLNIEFVADRSRSDVDAIKTLRNKMVASGWDGLTAEEKAFWNSNPKGAYNSSDLNRVGAAVQVLADVLSSFGYPVPISVFPKTDWNDFTNDPPRIAQMDRYINDIKSIRSAITVFSTTPHPPDSMNGLGYAGANNIEQILSDVQTILNNIEADYTHSAECFAGEDDWV